MSEKEGIKRILDKLSITARLELLSGMHIGASNDFSPIGAVDSVVVRDPATRQPMIPGSSLKGKLRSLLARTESDSYILNRIDNDSTAIKRMFGASNPVMYSRLQFYDAFLFPENAEKIRNMSTDLDYTEVKFENTINRITAVANPRQIERVLRGSEFNFRIVYNLEDVEGEDKLSEAREDFSLLAKAFLMLQLDYLGGHGSRGYGKVALRDFSVTAAGIGKHGSVKIDELVNILEGAAYDALLQR